MMSKQSFKDRCVPKLELGHEREKLELGQERKFGRARRPDPAGGTPPNREVFNEWMKAEKHWRYPPSPTRVDG
jgi:hypothetical protein